MLNTKPINTKMIPPIYSYFQAKINIPSNMNDVIKWIRKPPICSQIDSFGSKASNANKLKKRMAKMQIILGVQ